MVGEGGGGDGERRGQHELIIQACDIHAEVPISPPAYNRVQYNTTAGARKSC